MCLSKRPSHCQAIPYSRCYLPHSLALITVSDAITSTQDSCICSHYTDQLHAFQLASHSSVACVCGCRGDRAGRAGPGGEHAAAAQHGGAETCGFLRLLGVRGPGQAHPRVPRVPSHRALPLGRLLHHSRGAFVILTLKPASSCWRLYWLLHSQARATSAVQQAGASVTLTQLPDMCKPIRAGWLSHRPAENWSHMLCGH